MRARIFPSCLSAGAALLVTACTDATGPAASPGVRDQPPVLFAVSCRADLEKATVRCGGPSGSASRIVLGGQHVYVTLTSSNVAVSADTIAFDVTVTNLIPQPLGTTNFSSADPSGIRVFFMSGPTSTSGGALQVANAAGTGTFTQAAQPYFQYPGLLATDSTSSAVRWKLQFSPEVTSFEFLVAVAAAVPYPDGYVLGNPYVLTLNPSEVRTLEASVMSAVGTTLPGEPVSWISNNPSVVSMTGDQATGAGVGFAEITVSSGIRPATFTTAVSVCQSTVVGTGYSSAQAISTGDCFSAFGSNDFRPSTSYYGDLYRVSLTAGQTVTITLDTGNNLDTYLILADPRGLAVAVNDDDADGILGVGSRVVYTATASGTYVFEASTFNGLDTGNYTVGVTVS